MAQSISAVLNSSPRAPPLYIFFMSLLVNTPDSDNQLVRSALHEWTVFRLTCSLHSVHCSLLPEQGKAAEVYFTSEHSFMDLRCATSLRTDECDIIYVCKYIQFKFTSRTLQCTMNGIRSLRTGIMEEYRVMSTSQGTCVGIEQTSEVIRVTYEMCRAVGREDWNWEPLVYIITWESWAVFALTSERLWCPPEDRGRRSLTWKHNTHEISLLQRKKHWTFTLSVLTRQEGVWR